MSFIKVLKINITGLNEEEIFSFEDYLIEQLGLNHKIEFNTETNSLFIYKDEFKDDDSVSFQNYLEAGKITKEYLIKNKLATLESYKSLYTIVKEEIKKENEIDKFIAEVPKDDAKLSEAMAFLNKLKKKD